MGARASLLAAGTCLQERPALGSCRPRARAAASARSRPARGDSPRPPPRDRSTSSAGRTRIPERSA
eukprot:9504001-Pyramimonas_sp.AAC.9